MEAHALVLPSMTKKGGDVGVVVHVVYLEPQWRDRFNERVEGDQEKGNGPQHDV